MLFAISLLLILVSPGFSQQFVPENQGQAIPIVDLIDSYDQAIATRNYTDQKGWKAYGRWIEFTRQRLAADGQPADPAVFLEATQQMAAKKEEMAAFKTGQAWSPVGPFEMPGTYSSAPSYGMGRINCITFHPTDPNTYWIGVAQGGVWKTTDGGDSYMPLTDDLPILRISDIAVNPVNPEEIYISVCDYAYIGVALNTDQRKRHTHYGLGVYKTTNGGETWEPTGLSFSQTSLDVTLIRRVLFSPDNPDVLLAAGVSGIFKSTDRGASWNQIRNELIWDIEQDLTDKNVIYASPGFVQTLGQGQAGLLKSADFGETWTTLDPGFPGNQSVSRVEIGLTSEDPDYIYLVAANNAGGLFGIYRSVDGGATFETQRLGSNSFNILAWSTSGQGNGGQGWYDLAILVDPKNKERVFVGGINMWGSEDGGLTWSPCSYWVMYNGFTLHADHHQYHYNPLEQKYYACHDGGVARTSEIILGSANNNYNWPTVWEERSNGMAITAFYRLGLSEMFPGYVIAGAQDNSTFYNRNGSWVNIIGGDGMEALIHPDNPNTIFGSSQYGNWSRSTDGGKSFQGIRPTNNEDGGWTTPMVMDPNNPEILYAGYGNVWKSTNLGSSWTKISNFPVIQGYGKPAIISALTVAPSDPNYIYVAKRIHHKYDSPSTLWRTSDGMRWQNVTEGLPDHLYFSYLAVDDDNPQSIWVSCSGFDEGHKVYYSPDAGETWENRSFDLPNIPVNTIVHQAGSDQNLVYIGTDAGVYYTSDERSGWSLFSTDLPNVIVSELEIHYPTKKLYAATFGRGIWMADLASGSSSADHPDAMSRLLVYPNPSAGQLDIEYAGLPAGKGVIDLVDITGQVVFSRDIHDFNGSGAYRLTPDVGSGVYFVRIWKGSMLRTSRIVIH